MEDDMKSLVSDEIKKFRQSYQVGIVLINVNSSAFNLYHFIHTLVHVIKIPINKMPTYLLFCMHSICTYLYT